MLRSRDLKDTKMTSERHQIKIHILKSLNIQNKGGDHSMEEKVSSLRPQAQGPLYILDMYIYTCVYIYIYTYAREP